MPPGYSWTVNRVVFTVTQPIVLCIAACSPAPSTPPSPTSGPVEIPTAGGGGTAAPSGPAATGTPSASNVAGAWTSPSCGERKYERQLTLHPDGTFEAADLVSPCPKGVQCVWSGIAIARGTWKQSGASIRLEAAPTESKRPGQPLPEELGIDPATSAPVERAGGAACVYQPLPPPPGR